MALMKAATRAAAPAPAAAPKPALNGAAPKALPGKLAVGGPKPLPAAPAALPQEAFTVGVSEIISPATVTVNRTRVATPSGEILEASEDAEQITVNNFLTKAGSVTIGAKRRINLGNYEHYEVSVMISHPGYAEELAELAGGVSELVQTILAKELEGVESAQSGQAEAGEDPLAANEGEGQPEAEAAGEDEDGGITPDYINSLDRKSIEALIAQNELATDPKQFRKIEDLRAALIAEIFEGEGEAAEEAVDESGEAAAGDEEFTPYTQADLEGATTEDLKTILTTWGIDLPKPGKAATPAAIKKGLIAKVLEVQAAHQAAQAE